MTRPKKNKKKKFITITKASRNHTKHQANTCNMKKKEVKGVTIYGKPIESLSQKEVINAIDDIVKFCCH